MKRIRFYTLLYCEKNRQSLIQNFGDSDDFDIYVSCCKALHDSLTEHGFELTILTNEPDVISRKAPSLPVMSIPFTLKIPEDIAFYGAHHKIDVYDWFSKQAEDYSVLLDLDEVCINYMPENMIHAIEHDIPLYYDITSQIYPDAGRKRLIHDKTILSPDADIGLWAGGEFIGGTADFYKKLYETIISFSNTYFSRYKEFFHQGDEMLTSVAIELLIRRGTVIVDAGSFGGIRRYWSVGTNHCELLFLAVKDSFLLHIPADKRFIAKGGYDSAFSVRYEKYLRSEKTIATHVQIPRLFWMRVKNKLKRIFVHK